MAIEYREGEMPTRAEVMELYKANRWSSASKPDLLMKALGNAHHIVCAYDGATLVGLASAISDGHLVVYYPHLLVHPSRQGMGIGRALMDRMVRRYRDIHQQTLLAVEDAADFYARVGFERAESIVPMWIYDSRDE